MEELSGKTLAQIVTGNYKAAAVFEKYSLDFCCKGKRSLQQACEEQNLPFAQILDELLAINALNGRENLPFEKLSLTRQVDYIVSIHHEYVKKEMPLLFGYLNK